MKKLYTAIFVILFSSLTVTGALAVTQQEVLNATTTSEEVLPVDENPDPSVQSGESMEEPVATVSFKLPNNFTSEGSMTSDLSAVTADELTAYEGLVLDIPDYGMIEFTESVDLSDSSLSAKFADLNKYVKMGFDAVDNYYYVSIDITNLPMLDVPAMVTMKNVEATANTALFILKNGIDPQGSVLNMEYNPQTQEVTYDVTDWGEYKLLIVDENASYRDPYNGNNLNNSGLVLVLIFGSIATAVLFVYLLEKNQKVLSGGKKN